MKPLIFTLLLIISTTRLSLSTQSYQDYKQSYKDVVYKISETGDSLLLDVFLPDMPNSSPKIPVVILNTWGRMGRGKPFVGNHLLYARAKEVSQ